MRARSIATLLFPLLCCACAADPISPGPAGADLGVQDLAVRDLAAPVEDGFVPCALRAECDCWPDRRCRAVTEACWCPSEQCGDAGIDCACGGGRFRACVDERCPHVSCGPATPLVREADDCVRCAPAPDCEGALAALKTTCQFGGGFLSEFRCDKNRPCVTACLEKLGRCEDVGCGLCGVCDCARLGPFEQCVYACWR